MVADFGVDKYDIGTGFGHFGVAVEDVSSLKFIWHFDCSALNAKGYYVFVRVFDLSLDK